MALLDIVHTTPLLHSINDNYWNFLSVPSNGLSNFVDDHSFVEVTKASSKNISPVASPTATAVTNKKHRGLKRSSSASSCSEGEDGPACKRKKDSDVLDLIHNEIKDSVKLCRYWGKKCWNLRVEKAYGKYHSLCQFHRLKANENQRRMDYKRRGLPTEELKVEEGCCSDVSLFPTNSIPPEIGGSNFEPLAKPTPLLPEDIEFLDQFQDSNTGSNKNTLYNTIANLDLIVTIPEDRYDSSKK